MENITFGSSQGSIAQQDCWTSHGYYSRQPQQYGQSLGSNYYQTQESVSYGPKSYPDFSVSWSEGGESVVMSEKELLELCHAKEQEKKRVDQYRQSITRTLWV